MDKKTIIAFILCGIILLVYFPIILPKLSPPPPPSSEKKETIEEAERPKKEESEGASPKLEKTVPFEGYEEVSTSISPYQEEAEKEGIELQDHIVIQNENIVTVWTNEGGALKSVTLKEYKNTEKTGSMELLNSMANTLPPLSITKVKFSSLEDSREISLTDRRFRVVGNTIDKVSFQTVLENGIQITKNVYLAPEEYMANIEIIFRNKSNREITAEYQLVASSRMIYEGDANIDMGAVIGIDKGNGNYKLIKTNIKNLPDRNESVGISWLGSVNKYFAIVLKPASSKWISSSISEPISNGENRISEDFWVSVQTVPFKIMPQDEELHGYGLFLGPKLEKLLEKYELSSLLGFGTFESISKILLNILNGFYKIAPNYGVAILLLTILVKLMLFPLTRKSQTSMFKMQKLQPMIEQLKVKYKNDKQRMAKAQMELFKKHGANPLSGCLPMLLQLPVFFALFRTLQLSFEMRQAPFIFWINDLSMPDTLLFLPFSIPFLGNMLNILPIIMTVASFLQMKLSPKSPSVDPQTRMQQKMMSFMPFLFCFILYRMPSGLTLYWTTSTLLSIGETMFIRKSLKKLK